MTRKQQVQKKQKQALDLINQMEKDEKELSTELDNFMA